MLVIGRVVGAGREQHHVRIGRARRRRHRFERRQQFIGIVLDRRDVVAREQLGKEPQHDLPVLQHVGDAGRRARVVLQHIERVRIDADDVDAGDVHVDVVRDALAVHLRPEHRVLEHQVLRHHPGLEDLAAGVDVLDIGVDGAHPLLQPAPDQVPFARRDDAGQHVERDQPLGRIGVAIDREGDADAPENELGLAPAVVEDIGRNAGEPGLELFVRRADAAVRPRHLVKRQRHPAPGNPFGLLPILAASFAPAKEMCTPMRLAHETSRDCRNFGRNRSREQQGRGRGVLTLPLVGRVGAKRRGGGRSVSAARASIPTATHKGGG